MKQRVSLFTFILTIFFTFSYKDLGAAPDSCPEEYKKFYDDIKESADIALIRSTTYDAPVLNKIVGKWRDYIRRKLQINWQERKYPIIAMDDATPIKANTYARNAYGKIDNTSNLPFSPDEIKEEINLLIKETQEFPAKFHLMVDESATYAAHVKALEDMLSSGVKIKGNTFTLPEAKVLPDGTVQLTPKEHYYPGGPESLVLKQMLKEAKRELYQRIGNKWGMNVKEAQAIDQAIRIKKLETYRNELLDQFYKNDKKPLPSEEQSVLDTLSSFFKDEYAKELQDEYKIPYFAWEKLRWMQLNAEIKTIFFKDYPSFLEQDEVKKLVDFIKESKPEDLRALGVENISEATNLVKRSKWAIRLPVAGTIGSGITGAIAYWPTFKSFFIDANVQKEVCAAEEEDDAFNSCVIEYLQYKFPKKAIEDLYSKENIFVDSVSLTFKDPKVMNEVNNIINRRIRFLAQKKQKENKGSDTAEAIRKILATKDMGSDSYKDRIIESDSDEAFLWAMMGNAEKNVPSYLRYNYRDVYNKHHTLIEKILTSEYDSDEQSEWLDTIADSGAEDFAKELTSILKQRYNKKNNGSHNDRRRPRRARETRNDSVIKEDTNEGEEPTTARPSEDPHENQD